jgi:hypothetical protein
MEVRYLPGPGAAGYVVTARDLTEKKWRKLEAALSPVQYALYIVMQPTIHMTATAVALF